MDIYFLPVKTLITYLEEAFMPHFNMRLIFWLGLIRSIQILIVFEFSPPPGSRQDNFGLTRSEILKINSYETFPK